VPEKAKIECVTVNKRVALVRLGARTELIRELSTWKQTSASEKIVPTPEKSPWFDRLVALKNIPLVLKILWQSSASSICWGVGLRIVFAALPFLAAKIAQHIIDGIGQVLRGSRLPPHFWEWVTAEIATNVVMGLISRLIDYFDTLLANSYTERASVSVMEQAARLDLTSYENPEFYDRLERARVQATDRLVMIQQMGRLLQLSLTTIIFSAALGLASPWLLILLLIAVVPSFLGESHFAFLAYAKNFRQTQAKREMDYLRQIAGSREGIKEIKLFGLSEFLLTRFRDLARRVYDEDISLARSRLLGGALLSLVGTAGYYGAFLWVIVRTLRGEFTLGYFTFLTAAIQQSSSNLQQVFSTASGIADQAIYLTDLVEFFRAKPSVVNVRNGLKAPRPISQGFEFRNVSFAYPGTQRVILHNFNLVIHPGERIALIGENGQGKTTIVKLLTRLYDPTEGEILLDGRNLRDYDIEDLHRQIGVIFQDFMRYEMTARVNVAAGDIERLADDAALQIAAEKSLAASVIDKLAGGYEQLLGRRFEGGVELSGGEWQRIALARAYLRNTQLLVLDEPTAALDAKSELEVFQQFSTLTEGKMAILISHRFSTVRMADRIVVLSGGRLIEEGNHSSLMEKRGIYAEMFEMQAASYR